MSKVVDKLATSIADVGVITLASQTGPALLWTDGDRKLSTSNALIPDSLLATITTTGKIADSATTASVTNTPNTIVKTDTPVANVNVSSFVQTTPDALFVRGNAGQAISSNTLTKFTSFTGGDVLNQGSITRSSGDFKIGLAGAYSISAHVQAVANTTGWRRAQIVLNGSTILSHVHLQSTKTNNSWYTTVGCEVNLAANDVITFWCEHNTTTLNMSFNRVSIIRLH